MAAAAVFVLAGEDAGRSFPIEEAVVIGRSRDADIVIHDSEVSRQHLRARAEGETLVVEDLGSSNGTFCDGDRVEGPVRLREGNSLRIGSTVLEFRYETTAADDATPTEATSIQRRQS